MRIIILILACCIFVTISLAQRKNIQSNRKHITVSKGIDSIIVYAMPLSSSTIVTVTCKDLMKRQDVKRIDLTPYKDSVLKYLALGTKGETDFEFDARARMCIWHSNGQVDTAYFSNQTFINFNGKLSFLKDDNGIFDLIDSLRFAK